MTVHLLDANDVLVATTVCNAAGHLGIEAEDVVDGRVAVVVPDPGQFRVVLQYQERVREMVGHPAAPVPATAVTPWMPKVHPGAWSPMTRTTMTTTMMRKKAVIARVVLVALVGLGACGGSSGSPDTVISITDASSSSDTDTTPSCEGIALACEPSPSETCGACFLQIARCCYADEDIQGQIGPLTTACEGRVECLRCCDECAQLDCVGLRAAQLCPTVIDP